MTKRDGESASDIREIVLANNVGNRFFIEEQNVDDMLGSLSCQPSGAHAKPSGVACRM